MTDLYPGIVHALRAAGCVFAEDEADLILATARDAAEAATMVERRAAGLPLEHVLGWASFAGLRIALEPGVFVPRRRTEFLVAEAVAVCRPGDVVVDLCCGSGAVGAAVAAQRDVTVHGADIEPAAVRTARRNLAPFAGQVYAGDLYDALPDGLRGKIDLLLANVPYVPTGEIQFLPPEARDHEPRITLDGGDDGLDTLRRVAAGARAWLAPGGHVFTETSVDQAPVAVGIFAEQGLTARTVSDPDETATVVTAYRPS